MLKQLMIALAIGATASAAFANDAARAEAKQTFNLKDGATVYVFSDGKMAMESKFGHAVRMDKDTVMETVDGQKIVMKGDEVARLDSLLRKDYSSSN